MLLSDCGLIPLVLYKPRTRISKGFPVQGAPGFVENHRNPVILHGHGRNTAIPITIGTKRTRQCSGYFFACLRLLCAARSNMNCLGFGIDALKSINQQPVGLTRSREQAVVGIFTIHRAALFRFINVLKP